MPLEYKSAIDPEECSEMLSPEYIDWIHLIWYAYNCPDSQLSDSEIHPSPVSEEIHLRSQISLQSWQMGERERTYQIGSSHYWPLIALQDHPQPSIPCLDGGKNKTKVYPTFGALF